MLAESAAVTRVPLLYLLRTGPRAFQSPISSYLGKPKFRAYGSRDQAMAMNASTLGL